jgi:hypothetical protein
VSAGCSENLGEARCFPSKLDRCSEHDLAWSPIRRLTVSPNETIQPSLGFGTSPWPEHFYVLVEGEEGVTSHRVTGLSEELTPASSFKGV